MWESFVSNLQWLWDNPKVVWSGIGVQILVWLVALVVLLFVLFCKFFKKNPRTTSKELPTSLEEDLYTWPPNLRCQMLRRLRNDLKKRIDSFFHQREPLNLDKQLAPENVSHPHSILDYHLEKAGTKPRPVTECITDIFNQNDIRKRLAILGKPGSGKTSSLLELVDHLLILAEKDEQAALPVVFECSEWDGEGLLAWMAHSLNLKYDIKELQAQKLIRDRAVFPLFDGLDELMKTQQAEFVQAFNQFQNGRSLVLCCRLKEYRDLQENLTLNSAVILQDISPKKLEAYLNSLKLEDLWNYLQRSESGVASLPSSEPNEHSEKPQTLMQLAQRPLFLGMIIDLKECLLQQSAQFQVAGQAEQLLWNLYLDYWLEKTQHNRIASDDPPVRSYPKKQSAHWLQCLAKRMTCDQKVELRIEQMQPSWLRHYWKFGLFYGLAYGLAGGLAFGLLGVLAFGLVFGLAFFGLPGIISNKWTAKIVSGLAIGLARGLAIGLTFGIISFFLTDEKPQTIEVIKQLRLPKTLQDWKALGLCLAIGLVIWLVLWLTGGLIIGLVIWLVFWLTGGLIIGLEYLETQVLDMAHPNQSLFYAARTSLLLTLTLSLLSTFVFMGLQALSIQMGFAGEFFSKIQPFQMFIIMLVLCFFQLEGGTTVLKHYLLRLLLWQEGQLPLQLVPWLEWLQHRRVLQRVGGSYHFIHKQLQEHLAQGHWKPSYPLGKVEEIDEQVE